MATEHPQERFTVKFTGEIDTVRAETLVAAVAGQAAALQKINEYLDPERRIEIRISAPRKGSFQFDIHLVHAAELAVATAAMFYPGGIDAIISAFSNLLGLLKHLNGNKAKSIEQRDNSVAVENAEGDVLVFNNTVIHIYEKQPSATEALSSTFRALNREDAIDGMLVTKDDDGESILFEAERKDFTGIIESGEDVQSDKRVDVVRTTIVPTTFQTEKGYQWKAYHEGNKIGVYIKDEEFMDSLPARRFGKGDAMEVTLEITQEYDSDYDTWKNKSFVITEVHKYIPSSRQPDLFQPAE